MLIIFADSFLGRVSRTERLEQISALERALDADRQKALSTEEFTDRSWSALGRLGFPAETGESYQQFSRDLFDDGCAMLADHDITTALITVRQKWNQWMKTIGRKSGNQLGKLVINVLSYESRAAFHHCYSAAWSVLIPLLKSEEGWSEAACAFHRFWHTDWINSRTFRSLFHGHIFGLHPATAAFMQTTTGPVLLEDWLANSLSDELFRRVLNGLLIAVFDYRQRRELAAEMRPNRRVQGTGNLEAEERTQDERRQVRRRRRRSDGDRFER